MISLIRIRDTYKSTFYNHWRRFIDCSAQQPNEQSGDLPMTTTYESIDPSSTLDPAYARIQKSQHDFEYVNAAVPANDDYLIPNPLYTRAKGMDTGVRDHTAESRQSDWSRYQRISFRSTTSCVLFVCWYQPWLYLSGPPAHATDDLY